MKTAQIPVGVSSRHVHLSQPDLEALFGRGFRLAEHRPLFQPGQFAADAVVSIVGPRGMIDRVRVIGPPRKATQVEISRTDAFRLGIDTPVRASGDLAGTPGLRLIGPRGEVSLDQGTILAHRHIHMNPRDAQRLGVRDRDRLRVRTPGVRAVDFANVLVRVNEGYALELHLDTDEANAAFLCSGDHVTVFLPEPASPEAPRATPGGYGPGAEAANAERKSRRRDQ